MKENLLALFEFLSVVPFYLITFGLLNKIYKGKDGFNSKKYLLMTLIFAVYIFGVFYFTGVGTIFQINYYGGVNSQLAEFNLIPFSREIDTVAYVYNVLMFIPFGILVPFIWSKTNNFKTILGYGFIFSLIIEISQLLNYRQTDIDDLLMNTLGAIIGFLLFKMISKIIKMRSNFSEQIKCEPMIYILTMFLSHFLLFNEFYLAKIIWGF